MGQSQIAVFRWYLSLSSGLPTGAGETKYFTQGTHLHVREIAVGKSVYIRLGTAPQPWVRVKEGDTLSTPDLQPFTEFSIRTDDDNKGTSWNGQQRGRGYVLMYVSTGPFVTPAVRQYGMRRSMIPLHALALTSTLRFLSDLVSSHYIGVNSMTVGRDGGTLLIRNADATNDIIVAWVDEAGTPIGGASYGFRIPAGATLTLELEEVMEYSPADPNHDSIAGLAIGTLSGTATCDLILSSCEVDLTELGSVPQLAVT